MFSKRKRKCTALEVFAMHKQIIMVSMHLLILFFMSLLNSLARA